MNPLSVEVVSVTGAGWSLDNAMAVYFPETAIVPADILEQLALEGIAGQPLPCGVLASLSDMAAMLTPERAQVFREQYPNNITFDGRTPLLDFSAEAPQIGWVELVWEVGMNLNEIFGITGGKTEPQN